MRILGFLGVLTLLTLSSTDSQGDPSRSKPANSVPSKQSFRTLDVTQARADGSTLWVKDDQGRSWPLTVDVALQRSAQHKLASVRPESGALVAIEFKTGKIRVFSEWPAPESRDQSLLMGRQFPAASLFKIVTTAALVEQARIAPEQIVCTEGGMHRIELEHLLAPHEGVVQCRPFIEALGYSRNAAFAQLVHHYLKPDDLDNYADRFGFGSPLPLEIGIPLGQFSSETDPLIFARNATGFTGSTLSPLGAAYLAYVVANRGRAASLQILENAAPTPLNKGDRFAPIRPETAEVLKRMMEITVRRGTCWRAFHDEHGRPYLPRVSVAGKTGTLGDLDTTVSWFVGYAPSQRPEIVVSVILKNGPIWQKKANEVARQWLVDYFERAKTQPIAKAPLQSDKTVRTSDAVAVAAIPAR